MNVGRYSEPIYGISLFSGVDGLGRGVALALPGLRTVAYVEREAYPVEVLAQEMEAGTLDQAPVFSDVVTFPAGEFARRVLRATGRRVEVVYGGFPCQDISTAGKGDGIAGERSGLWSEFARIIREVGPSFVFVENVAALIGRGLPTVLQAFTECGYRYAWGTLEAADVGATHHRKRLFVVAVADGGSERRQQVVGGAHGDEGENAWGCAPHDHIAECHGESLDRTSALVDNQGVGCSQGWTEPILRSGWHAATGTSRDGSEEALEDAAWGREPGSHGQDGGGGRVRQAGEPLDVRLPAYPPGPDELDDWHHIIESHPELAPAIVGSTPTQPSLRRVADGLADRHDLCVRQEERHEYRDTTATERNSGMKTCSKCGVSKPLERFSPRSSAPDAPLRNQCKECRTAMAHPPGHGNPWRDSNPERNAIAHRAHESVARAIRNGTLVRPDECEVCGKQGQRIYAAHDDYSKPLEVHWLCVTCHNRWDRYEPKTIKLCECPRAERLKALGNGVVPMQAAVAYMQLLARLGES